MILIYLNIYELLTKLFYYLTFCLTCLSALLFLLCISWNIIVPLSTCYKILICVGKTPREELCLPGFRVLKISLISFSIIIIISFKEIKIILTIFYIVSFIFRYFWIKYVSKNKLMQRKFINFISFCFGF